MTREYLQEPMAEIGEDYDANYRAVRDMLSLRLHGIAESLGESVRRVNLQSEDNGGFTVQATLAGRETPITIDLADDETLSAIWSGPEEADAHVRGQMLAALRAVAGGERTDGG